MLNIIVFLSFTSLFLGNQTGGQQEFKTKTKTMKERENSQNPFTETPENDHTRECSPFNDTRNVYGPGGQREGIGGFTELQGSPQR